MKSHTLLFVLISLFFLGCAGQKNIYTETQRELYLTVDQMYEAILRHNAPAVYSMLSYATWDEESFQEFEIYFNENYEVILEEFTRYRDNIRLKPFELQARLKSDTCGISGMLMDESGQWHYVDKLHLEAVNTDEFKEYVISVVNDKEFDELVNRYFSSHPEVSIQARRRVWYNLRDLTRDDVEMDGIEVRVKFRDNHYILLRCQMGQGWELTGVK